MTHSPPSGIWFPGPGRPRGHARPVIDWALRTRLTPERGGGPTADRLAQPERRLMIAVLDEAIGTFLKAVTSGRRPRDLRELERWFTDTDTSWPCSFLRICEALDLAPERVRQGLTRWCASQGDFFARRTAAKLGREKRRRGRMTVLPPARDEEDAPRATARSWP